MRTKQDRYEVPAGTGFQANRTAGPSLSETHTLWDAHRKPTSEYQALMECDFGEEPETALPSGFLDHLDKFLTPQEAAVINFVVTGGMSLRKAGKYLGAEFPRNGVPTPYSKTTVSNLKQSALNKLRIVLEEL